MHMLAAGGVAHVGVGGAWGGRRWGRWNAGRAVVGPLWVRRRVSACGAAVVSATLTWGRGWILRRLTLRDGGEGRLGLVRGLPCALKKAPATCKTGLRPVRATLGHVRFPRHYGIPGEALAPARRCGGLGCRACICGVWSASRRVLRALGCPLWSWRRRRQRGRLGRVAYVG